MMKCCHSQSGDVPKKPWKNRRNSDTPKKKKKLIRDLAKWSITTDLLLVLVVLVFRVVEWVFLTCKPSTGLINRMSARMKRTIPVIRTRIVVLVLLIFSSSSGEQDADVEHPENDLKVDVHQPINLTISEKISRHIRTDILYASKDHPSNYVKLCSYVNGSSKACTFDALLCKGISCWSNGFSIPSAKPEHAGTYDMLIDYAGAEYPLSQKFNLSVIELDELTTQPAFLYSLFSIRNSKTDGERSNKTDEILKVVVPVVVTITIFLVAITIITICYFCFCRNGSWMKSIRPVSIPGNEVRASMLPDTEDPDAHEENEIINV